MAPPLLRFVEFECDPEQGDHGQEQNHNPAGRVNSEGGLVGIRCSHSAPRSLWPTARLSTRVLGPRRLREYATDGDVRVTEPDEEDLNIVLVMDRQGPAFDFLIRRWAVHLATEFHVALVGR